MPSFFFGPGHSLYGTYHPPSPTATGQEHAVVICGSLGAEYMRSYRALWQVAEALTERNTHVLRFDYFATGESHGRQSEASWSRWLDDVRSACRWLHNETALYYVRVLSHRVGALIAGHALAHQSVDDGAGKLETMTLWDPVINGRYWLDTQRALNAEFVRRSNRFRARDARYSETDTDEFLGFHYPSGVVQSLEQSRMDRAELQALNARFSLGLSDTDELPADWLDDLSNLSATADGLKPPNRWSSISEVDRRLIVRPSLPRLMNLVLA